jgi:hypothetical protein
MLSILPADGTQTAMGGSDSIVFTAKATTFLTNSADLVPTTRPTAATPPDPLTAVGLTGALMLGCGSLVFSSLL